MSGNQEVRIHDVWNSNVEEEFGKLRSLIEDYPFVAMDTEFPGVVATPLGTFKSKEDFNYQQVSCNVNMLKLIQVGFALVDEKGDLPPTGDVWQFNFHFSLNDDMYSQESVEMLRAAGIDFNRLQSEGISMDIFGELLTTSGLVVDEKITWLTFSSGYDFGYLLKSITLGELPKEESQFFQFHRALFPRCYDIKLMLRMPGSLNTKLKGGLQEVADQLDVKRHGVRHQAGSDALLTAKTFFKIKQQFFSDNWEKVSRLVEGHLFGLGSSLSLSQSAHKLDELDKEKEAVAALIYTLQPVHMPSNRRRKHTISNKLRKRPGKDIDQIHEEMKPNKAAKLLNQEVDLDLPGDGQFYCIECARYFIDEKTRRGHQKSKLHKNRLRTLKEVPYTIKESEAAAGHGHYERVTVKSKITSNTGLNVMDEDNEQAFV